MIFKKKNNSKFTAISNEVCNDVSVSTDARWCLWYLLTKPADWEVRIGDIRKSSGWGRNKTYAVIKELSEARYLMAVQGRDKDGQFSIVSYNVYEEPCDEEPYTENPRPENRDTVNREHNKDLEKQKTEKKVNTEEYISADFDLEEEFNEFWSVYPSRSPHSNPKAEAKKKYVKVRKQGVSKETIVNAAKKYADIRLLADDGPKFTAQAITWLNQWRFEDDYTMDGGTSSQQLAATDEHLDAVVKSYGGIVSDRAAAKKSLAAEIAKGVTLEQIVAAAEKSALLRKQMRYDGIDITPPILETWLKFKWREMDAYEFCRVGADRIKTVRPIKVGK